MKDVDLENVRMTKTISQYADKSVKSCDVKKVFDRGAGSADKSFICATLLLWHNCCQDSSREDYPHN